MKRLSVDNRIYITRLEVKAAELENEKVAKYFVLENGDILITRTNISIKQKFIHASLFNVKPAFTFCYPKIMRDKFEVYSGNVFDISCEKHQIKLTRL